MKLEVYGASDDLIEIQGSIQHEHAEYSPGKKYLAFGNGALISIEYDGEWKIQKHREPEYVDIDIRAAGEADEEEKKYPTYTDVAVIETEESMPFNWVSISDKVVKDDR